MDNLQTNKKYFIPMEVTPEIIKAFNINAEEVQWTKIGNKSVRVIMVPATEEQYYAYMRPLWREDKQNQRASKQEDEGKMKPVSLDQLYEDTEFETADQATNIEADYMKKVCLGNCITHWTSWKKSTVPSWNCTARTAPKRRSDRLWV